MRRLVEVEGVTLREVVRRLGVTVRRVEYRAHREGIESQHRRRRRPELHDPVWLRRQFDAGRAIAEVADELGVTYGTVVNARAVAGIAPKRKPKRPVDIDEVLRRLEARRVDGSDRAGART